MTFIRYASIFLDNFTVSTVQNNWKGYVEDRRPASNGDPYKITKRLLETLQLKQELVE